MRQKEWKQKYLQSLSTLQLKSPGLSSFPLGPVLQAQWFVWQSVPLKREFGHCYTTHNPEATVHGGNDGYNVAD